MRTYVRRRGSSSHRPPPRRPGLGLRNAINFAFSVNAGSAAFSAGDLSSPLWTWGRRPIPSARCRAATTPDRPREGHPRAPDRGQLSQEALGHRAEIHPTWISHIESGRINPTWGNVRRIAIGLGVPLCAAGGAGRGASSASSAQPSAPSSNSSSRPADVLGDEHGEPARLLARHAGYARDPRRLERAAVAGAAGLARAQPGDRPDPAGRDLVRRRPADAGPDPDPPAGPHLALGARRPAADPLAQLAGAGAARHRLHRRLHRRRLDADRRRPAHAASRAGSTSRRASWRSSSSARSPSSRSPPRRSTSASRARPSPTSCTSPASS